MLNVLLICSMGASTAVLCEKIKEAAANAGDEIDIHATALSVSGDEIPQADVILLGPQIRYMLKKVESDADGKPVRAIDMATYGKIDGEAVYQIIKEMKEHL